MICLYRFPCFSQVLLNRGSAEERRGQEARKDGKVSTEERDGREEEDAASD